MSRDMGFVKKAGCIGALVLALSSSQGCATIANTVVSVPLTPAMPFIVHVSERKEVLTKNEVHPLVYYGVLFPIQSAIMAGVTAVGGPFTGICNDIYFARHFRYPEGYNPLKPYTWLNVFDNKKGDIND